MHSIMPGGLAGDRRGVLPASGFFVCAQQMWRVIKENKDLDLPAHKLMVTTVRCEEIANVKLSGAFDEAWLEIMIWRLSILMKVLEPQKDNNCYLECYNLYILHCWQWDIHVQNLLINLTSDLEQSLKGGRGFVASVRDCTQCSLLQFDQECSNLAIKQADWDASRVREKLQRDIEAHATSIRSTKLSYLIASYERQITEELAEPVESLFDAAGQDTWASIRKLYKQATDKALAGFMTTLSGFELDHSNSDKMKTNLKHHARNVVEKKCREEAGKTLIRLKEARAMTMIPCQVFVQGNRIFEKSQKTLLQRL